MARPTFAIQQLESRRMLSATAVEDFAAALGKPNHLTETNALQTDLGLRANHQQIDRQLADLKAALAELARLQGG